MSREPAPLQAWLGKNPYKSAAYRTALRSVIEQALAEDIGSGDVAAAIFPPRETGKGHFLAKQDGILSGTSLARETFRQLSPTLKIKWTRNDGEAFAAGDILGQVSGPFGTLLQAERVSLNFLQRMSGIATLTRSFVDKLPERSRAGIYDTRKTTPGLRIFEKQAVEHGGGKNHRFGLYDMAMLKNNHIDAAGGVGNAVARLRDGGFYSLRPRRLLCVEARNLAESLEAVAAGADIVMLDNMAPPLIRRTVEILKEYAARLKRPMPQIEVSGGINLKTVGKYGQLPIDRISVGAITHSAPALDIALHFD